jgi:hypothetical protein
VRQKRPVVGSGHQILLGKMKTCLRYSISAGSYHKTLIQNEIIEVFVIKYPNLGHKVSNSLSYEVSITFNAIFIKKIKIYYTNFTINQ